MKKIVASILFVSLPIISFGQSLTYYPFNSLLSVSTNPARVAWLDFRIQTNSFASSLSTEVAPAFNLNSNPKARMYVGGGARFNFLAASFDGREPLEGLFLNVGVRSALFEKYPGIQVAFELSPYANKDFDLGTFRANLGIGYNFSKKKQ
jgi:hypothetical protein